MRIKPIAERPQPQKTPAPERRPEIVPRTPHPDVFPVKSPDVSPAPFPEVSPPGEEPEIQPSQPSPEISPQKSPEIYSHYIL